MVRKWRRRDILNFYYNWSKNYQNEHIYFKESQDDDNDEFDIDDIMNKLNDMNIDPEKEEDEEEDDDELDDWISDNMGSIRVNIPEKYHKSIDLYIRTCIPKFSILHLFVVYL